MTAPQGTTNTTERDPRPSGSPPEEGRRASGPERQSTMPPSDPSGVLRAASQRPLRSGQSVYS